MTFPDRCKLNEEDRSSLFPLQETGPNPPPAILNPMGVPFTSSTPPNETPDVVEQTEPEAADYVRQMSELTSRVKEGLIELGITLEKADTCITLLEDNVRDLNLSSSIYCTPETPDVDETEHFEDRSLFGKRHRNGEDKSDEDADHNPENSIDCNINKDDKNEGNISHAEKIIKNIRTENVNDCGNVSGNLQSVYSSGKKASKCKNGAIEREGIPEMNCASSPAQRFITVGANSPDGETVKGMLQDGTASANKVRSCGLCLRIAPKRRTVTWSDEDNSLFIRIVQENRHIGDAQLRRLLTETFANRRKDNKCLNQVHTSRYQGHEFEKEDKHYSLKDK